MNRANNKWAAAMLFAVSRWASVPAQDSEEVVRVDIALVTVNVAVTDGKGRHISELKAGDFFVSDEVRLEFFDTEGPTSIIFVVDVSSSMRGEKWQSLKAGMKKFLATAREGNDYTLITFNEAPRLIARSVSAQDFWREFSSLNPSGNTALYDAILLGSHSFPKTRLETTGQFLIVCCIRALDNRGSLCTSLLTNGTVGPFTGKW